MVKKKDHMEALLTDDKSSADTPRKELLKSRQKVEERDPSHPAWVNFNEEEEITIINELTYLRSSMIMTYIVVPILSVCTLFIFAIVLYWKTSLRSQFFYRVVYRLEDATHMLVKGNGDALEIIEIYSTNSAGTRDTF